MSNTNVKKFIMDGADFPIVDEEARADIVDINNSLTQLETYSTSEVAIGKWIDGKTIYRRSFTGTCVQSTSLELATLSGIDKIISGYGWSTSFNNNSWAIPSGRTDGYLNTFYLTTNTKKLYLQFGAQYDSSNSFVFTVEYTKS